MAHAGPLSLFEGDWTNCLCPQVYCSDASKRGWSFASRTAHVSLVMVVFLNALASAVRPAVSVPGSTLSNKWGSPTRQEDEFFETEFEEVPRCSLHTLGVLSIVVDLGGTKIFLLLEARFVLRAVQCAKERHLNVRILFLLDNLALVVLLIKGRTRSFPDLAVSAVGS